MSLDLDRFVPHRGLMSLLDALIEHSDEQSVASVCITPQSTFCLPGLGVPAYVGLEYMAQTVAAFDGAKRHTEGAAPMLGFLLGTRRYQSLRDYFVPGETLVITATMTVSQHPVAAFDCTILIEEEVVATASLTVYRAEGQNLEFPGE
ncbi:3-hydroxylacyl-ACP dehydratase [Emcibacter sp. SYSU 3D8]|uniref:ApeP family dehydratase n=1 Tax=Emcibacter sp. SYSU 3D8 TaxID=3133969 RepID=UPI0031FEA8B1